MKLGAILLAAGILSAALPSQVSQARPVNELEPIVRELRIAEDIFRSAMANSIGGPAKIINVKTQFLARQGVLVSMKVVVPWIDVSEFTRRSIDIGTDIQSLHDIPLMVHEILAELDIAVTPYDPDELEALRELRAEQRKLRNEQRDLRSKLRDARRKRNRAEDEDDIDDLDDEIADLDHELNGLEDEYQLLDDDIDDQYQRLQDLRSNYSNRSLSEANLSQAVGETACNYGGTFKTLGSQQYLTVALELTNSTKYYVFKMEHIATCRRGEIDSAKLLERSYLYDV
jgi:hypothetical protein